MVISDLGIAAIPGGVGQVDDWIGKILGAQGRPTALPAAARKNSCDVAPGTVTRQRDPAVVKLMGICVRP